MKNYCPKCKQTEDNPVVGFVNGKAENICLGCETLLTETFAKPPVDVIASARQAVAEKAAKEIKVGFMNKSVWNVSDIVAIILKYYPPNKENENV